MKALHELITEHFKLTEADISDALTAKDIPEWDSMNYLLFIADVEKEYGISFTMDEMLNAQSLGDIKNIVRGKGVSL